MWHLQALGIFQQQRIAEHWELEDSTNRGDRGRDLRSRGRESCWTESFTLLSFKLTGAVHLDSISLL